MTEEEGKREDEEAEEAEGVRDEEEEEEDTGEGAEAEERDRAACLFPRHRPPRRLLFLSVETFALSLLLRTITVLCPFNEMLFLHGL